MRSPDYQNTIYHPYQQHLDMDHHQQHQHMHHQHMHHQHMHQTTGASRLQAMDRDLEEGKFSPDSGRTISSIPMPHCLYSKWVNIPSFRHSIKMPMVIRTRDRSLDTIKSKTKIKTP